jgi:hypothetical protein
MGSTGVAVVFRFLCHALMVLLAVYNETFAQDSIHDPVLDWIPYVGWIDSWNYHLWLLAYLPLWVWLWRANRGAFVHFLFVGGVLSLVRGVCIVLVDLGPVHGTDVNAGMPLGEIWGVWAQLMNPLSTFFGDGAHLHMTKDLFFSGHTGSTFLLMLYMRRVGAWAGRVAIVAHLFVVATVFLAHLHYAIDVVGAWVITAALFALARRYFPGLEVVSRA